MIFDVSILFFRIAKKLGNIPIVNEVVKTVKQSSKVMLNQLLSQLRAPIQLPACLKVVGYLRRMDAFSNETELRLRFLQARYVKVFSVLKLGFHEFTIPKFRSLSKFSTNQLCLLKKGEKYKNRTCSD